VTKQNSTSVLASCHRDVATDSRAPWPRIRKASRARAPDSPSPGEYMDVRTARPDREEPECRTPDQMRMANAFCRYLELATPVWLKNCDVATRLGGVAAKKGGLQGRGMAVVDIRAQFATWTWQRIIRRCASPVRGRPKGRLATMTSPLKAGFSRNPGGESGSRAWLAGAGRGQDARTARPDEEQPECKTPEQIKMANAFCRYLEMAERM
jgi:hypothetical protein